MDGIDKHSDTFCHHPAVEGKQCASKIDRTFHFSDTPRALCAGMQFSSLAVCFAANTKNALAAIIRASCGKETAKCIFFVFKRIKLHDGINVLRTKEDAVKRKSVIKLTISCVCWKIVVPLHPKVANSNTGERSPIKQSSAGGLIL